MTKIAEILIEEPSEYKTLLTSYLKQGFPFPAAREKAFTSYLHTNDPHLCTLLSAPNNILAIEYIKALLMQHSSICPLPIQREGSGYHTSDLHQKYCSATAVRNLMLNAAEQTSKHTDISQTLSGYVSPQTANMLLSPDTHFLTEQDFSRILYYKLLCEQEKGFSDYADISPEMSRRIVNALPGFTDFNSFCKTLKSKEVTYTRICRNLFHILLNIKKKDYDNAKNCGYIPYMRLLGFRKDASPFFAEIKKHTLRPLLTKPSKYASFLTEPALSMFRQDIFASNLYYGTLAAKSNTVQKNEYQKRIVIV